MRWSRRPALAMLVWHPCVHNLQVLGKARTIKNTILQEIRHPLIVNAVYQSKSTPNNRHSRCTCACRACTGDGRGEADGLSVQAKKR